GDSTEHAVLRTERAREKRAKRRGVDEATRVCLGHGSARDESHAPAHEIRHQVVRIDVKDLIGAERSPESLERRHGGGECSGVLREMRDIDSAGGDSGQYGETEIGIASREITQETDLIRAARTATAHDEGELADVGRGCWRGGLARDVR